jgi:hypothetical protein
MKKQDKARNVLRVLGYILLAWGILNTSVDIYRYGLGVGHYWWFCNLALTAMGWGLVTEDRGLIIGFLAIASYTQVFWLLDNLSVLLTHQVSFGLIDYMYQPGFPMDEFLLSHYHYFTIPIAIMAMFILPKSRMSAVKKSLIGNPFIFGVSYFVFPATQNVNCIHRACFPGWDNWTGPIYSIGFWLVLYGLHIAVAYALENKVLPYFTKTFDARKFIIRSMEVVCAVSVLMIGVDVTYKNSLPQISCAEQASATDAAAVSCRYVAFSTRESLTVDYRAINPTASRMLCHVEMQMGENTTVLHDQLPLDPHADAEFQTSIDTPTESLKISIRSRCEADGNQTAMLTE